MKIRHLLESSEDSFQGSLTPDLVASKLWICETLKELKKTKFSTVYVLGSWYGTMGYALKQCNIKFAKIINVEQDQSKVNFTDALYKKLHINSENTWADANTVDFSQADAKSLIINTSIQDIVGTRWFDSIPKGPLIVLQSRNNSETGHPDLKSFDELFKLQETLYVNQREFTDPETDYLRFLKVGVK